MRKKAITKTEHNPQIQQPKLFKAGSLSELSISEIYEQKPSFDIVDFQQERELIGEFLPKIDEAVYEYGLKLHANKPKLLKVKSKPAKLFAKEIGSLPSPDYEDTREGSSRKELRFDRDIRRKKSPSNYQLPS